MMNEELLLFNNLHHLTCKANIRLHNLGETGRAQEARLDPRGDLEPLNHFIT